MVYVLVEIANPLFGILINARKIGVYFGRQIVITYGRIRVSRGTADRLAATSENVLIVLADSVVLVQNFCWTRHTLPTAVVNGDVLQLNQHVSVLDLILLLRHMKQLLSVDFTGFREIPTLNWDLIQVMLD